jgi:hypothetical protein
VEAQRDRGADGEFRGPTAGLIDELTEWFTARFDKIRELGFEACPGETRCSTKKTGLIFRVLKDQPDREIESICAGCRLKETKPGTEPPHLTLAIQIANELEEESMVYGEGGMRETLDSLDPFEYACLLSIKAARRASENKAMKQPQQASNKPDVEHLRRLAHGY